MRAIDVPVQRRAIVYHIGHDSLQLAAAVGCAWQHLADFVVISGVLTEPNAATGIIELQRATVSRPRHQPRPAT